MDFDFLALMRVDMTFDVPLPGDSSFDKLARSKEVSFNDTDAKVKERSATGINVQV